MCQLGKRRAGDGESRSSCWKWDAPLRAPTSRRCECMHGSGRMGLWKNLREGFTRSNATNTTQQGGRWPIPQDHLSSPARRGEATHGFIDHNSVSILLSNITHEPRRPLGRVIVRSHKAALAVDLQVARRALQPDLDDTRIAISIRKARNERISSWGGGASAEPWMPVASS